MKEPETSLDSAYWNTRWENQQTGWDVGYASPAIVDYMHAYPDKNAAILIPGCGNAYEAEQLVAKGFTDITLIDIAPKACALLEEKFAGVPAIKILCTDFFAHTGHYDVMIEQTFFCAIPTDRRSDYAYRSAALLNPNGRIIGLLFNRSFEQQGPPFGGTAAEYESIFTPYFDRATMEPCRNSIPPRAGSELFVNLVKKST